MYSSDDFDPDKWTYVKVGGVNLAISPDGDCTVSLLETGDAEAALVNNTRSQTSWLDLYVSEEAPASISDVSLRDEKDQFIFTDEEDGDQSDEIYISLGSSSDADGSFMHPIEICCSRYTAHGMAQAIIEFMES